MASTETERLFVEHLKKAGERLVHPPSNVNELLSLLDQVECCLLLWITQPPSKSIENELGSLKEALAAEDLMTHSDIDVKVAVAACITELTRISAPAILYDDEQMKKVFRLIVGAFEGLSDICSRSYSKRVSILESMANDPSCAVLLNLKCCDDTILEMFQHFLKSIRDYHPKHVFSDMETIMMTLVLKGSDDVSFELLSLLVDSAGKKDEYVLPVGQKLAKKVIGNCFPKFKPDMIHHASVFDAECNGASANASGEHPANESKSLEKAGADRIPQEANKDLLNVPGSGLLRDVALGSYYQRVIPNVDTQIGSGDPLTYPGSPQKKPQCTNRDTDEAKTTDTAEKIEADNLGSKTVFMPETEPGQAIKKTREVQNAPERSFNSSNNRGATLECVETEDGFALIEPLERREKTKAAFKADKKLYAIESWENSKEAALEAELKKTEEQPGRKKAEYVEKMKNKVALIHKDAEEKTAMIEAKYGEEILKAEEIAGRCQASGATPTTPVTLICLICLICVLLFAFGGGVLTGYWIYEKIV